ncbi:TonB-dependent siderophore receptor [Mesorhizobium kowhaii]|uniref:TonB-dependent siderophore receptor n=1 Tax=Mesorhizobium kowhaii TaxID=1300272 RepID=UPI0011B7C4E1|nr:TonB-dependent siderophore receptor [Mesorhizobium kowhaii]
MRIAGSEGVEMGLSAYRAARRRSRAQGLVVASLSTLLCAQALAQDATTELNPINVEGQTGSPVGPDDGYIAKNTTTGSKTDTPLKEIPQSVSVITRKQLDDRQPGQLEDSLSYLAGVTTSPWGIDDRFDQCLIRGFDLCTSAIYRDGLPQKVIDFSGFKIEPYGLERIEVLKGPSSVLYGENEAGGMVNAITKRPTDKPIYDGFLSYDSFNTVEAGLDVGGPIDDAGIWSYRLTGLVRNGEIETDYSRNDRIFVAPALKWQPDAQTSLTILANYQWDRLTPIQFLPAEYGNLPRNFFTGSPDFDRFDANHGSIGYQFSHEFDDHWTVRQNLRYSQQETDYRQLYYGEWLGGPDMINDHTMSRTLFTVDETATLFNVDNQAEYKASFGAVENKLLFGLDYNRQSVDGQNGYGEGPPLDTLNADYSIPVTAPSLIIADRVQTIGQIGLYAQNQSKIADHWVLTLGGRQAWIDNTNQDRIGTGSYDQKDHAFTGNVGIGYLFDNGLTPYASYAESFTTNIGQTLSNVPFQPSKGKQYEVGVKYEPTFFPGYLTASLFDLRKTNVLTTDPSNPLGQVQTGEVRHRGLEIEANADLAFGLSTTAAYTYLDAEIAKGDDAGNRPARVPEHQASLWANYEVGSGVLEGLSFGAGVRYIGASFGDNTNTVNVPGHTLVDAALRYKKNGWQAALNVSNLFDKTYYSIAMRAAASPTSAASMAKAASSRAASA